ncbi:MAG TPA: sigma-54 dependent transcriptional regulator [Syntrophales bacterium]|jgi:DNA-binding NtrC family response regulator|nr:sigma-54 dependent transcriptional regulator [Syntrophales bacterium]HOU78226.1 sigma-54 dependent transcriptional regulator [Syntrophales bacterium]HPC33245.1 sigma-54 dependent transcriptional regulator [Syntrophales bacterium]HQG34515.1 sigma-54 dependent transcriptional regulator [Syntrophales bacterium]HQI36159.1 sigma-54 dependent transcriptional regulator [Syntrophales bacterium]
MKVHILVIDDDEVACEFLQEALRREGYEVHYFTSAKAALAEDLSRYDLLLSDIRMPGMDGLEFLKRVHEQWPELPVILMTAYGSLETTMNALRLGAWDYISKPFSPEAIRGMVKKVLDVRELRQKRGRGTQKIREDHQFIGSSATMVDFYKQVARVADAEASVLIEGESGTGKELTARSLHQLSIRRDKPFVVVHCGAIPDTLLESELFGYEKGAFTGADHSHAGLIESAQDGTIFLDEITEMSTGLQAKLLRFMQDGEVRRLGGHTVRHVSLRVVAAANRNIDEEIRKGTFRSDLLYRFVVRLHIPPLREHKEDLPQLVESLLKKLGSSSVRVSDEVMELFLAYDWPGNVRELQNVLQQTLLLSPFGLILPEYLPERFLPQKRKEGEKEALSPLEEAEREQILQSLKQAAWNQTRASQSLGIDRKTLRTKIQRYGLMK